MRDEINKIGEAAEPHELAARLLVAALRAQNDEIWRRFARRLAVILSPAERGCLAWTTLTAADPDDARQVAEVVLGEAGAPLPPFVALWPEAQNWAAVASEAERKAYAAAAVEALAVSNRAAFLRWAQGGGGAR